MDGLLIGALAVLVLLGIAFWAIRAGEMARGPNRKASAAQDAAPGDEAATPSGPAEAPSSDEADALERSKLVIHALLQGLSVNVTTMHGESAEYGTKLDHHKTAIKEAMTIEGLQELEKVMLTELDQMQTSNRRYRDQLEDANTKIEVQQEEMEQLQSDVGLDFLTRIPNRRALDNRVVEEVERTRRYGNRFALVMMDIDHFKRVNDEHGHLAGDRVLRGIAQLLDQHKRASDFLARFGGEEFVLVLPGTSAKQAQVMAEHALKKVERATFQHENKAIRITVSAGVGEILSKQDTGKALLARVDEALYNAKRNGRNRVELVQT